MSAALQPEQDTLLAVKLMSMRKTATDEEFGAVLRELLGTCRMEGFRISIQALKIILNESVKDGVEKLTTITSPPNVSQMRKAVDKVADTLPPQVRPMRTREEALAIHRQTHPELYNEDGTRKGFEKRVADGKPGPFDKLADAVAKSIVEQDDMDALERATRPDPLEKPKALGRVEGDRRRKIDDEGRADIRRRASQARLDNQGKHPKGWIKRVAEEYDVSDALIYQIVYSDPDYSPVPRA